MSDDKELNVMGHDTPLTITNADIMSPMDTLEDMVEQFGGLIYKKEVNPKPKRVAIVGSSSASLYNVPWDDQTIEIWTLAWRQGNKRVSRAFDMHRINRSRSAVPFEYEQTLAALKVPVYLQRTHKEIPNSVRYPIDEVTDCVGDYFASSVAYMIGLAIYEQYDEIQFHGIDLFHDSEYAYQRPNLEFLCGLAIGRGIKITTQPTSALLKTTHRYGYDLPPTHGTVNVEMIDGRIEDYKKQFDDIQGKAAALDGIMQELNQLKAAMNFARKGKTADV